MTNKNPLVSIIIPTYNRVDLIKKTFGVQSTSEAFYLKDILQIALNIKICFFFAFQRAKVYHFSLNKRLKPLN